MKIKIVLKMKKQIINQDAILLAILFISAAHFASAEEVTKEFHKEYTAQKGSKLDLNNRYGDIVVQTSETDQVVINVKVTVELPKQGKSRKAYQLY